MAVFQVKSTQLMNRLTRPSCKIISETLRRYLKGEDLTDSPYVQWGRRLLKSGHWFYDCHSEADLQRRQRHVLALYRSFKRYGYRPDREPITVYFDRDGHIYVHDGFHRLAVMAFLKIVADVNVEITDKTPPKFCGTTGDFPLVETLIKLNGGRNLYQPVKDPRLRDFIIWRLDSLDRLNWILPRLGGRTVLDVGCCEGFFSLHLTRRGYDVTALDSNRKRVAVARYLSIRSNLDLKCVAAHWYAYFKRLEDGAFDNILFLSVFHHAILNVGPDLAFKMLRQLKGKARRVFFEIPLTSQEVPWFPKNKRDLYSFSKFTLKQRLEEAMAMKVREIWHTQRPLFMLGEA